MEPENAENQVNIGRYIRFVLAFVLIMFSVLGVYEYYYGAQARKAQELEEYFNRANQPATAVVVTSTLQ